MLTPPFSLSHTPPCPSSFSSHQVDAKFIVLVCGDALVIADQHAVDERVRLERLTDAVLGARPAAAACTGHDEGTEAVLRSVALEQAQVRPKTRVRVRVRAMGHRV